MSIADAMAGIALGFSQALGVGFWPAIARWQGETEEDDGGSLVEAADPTTKTCSVQVSACAERMRLTPGYTDKDAMLLVLAATLDGELNTDAEIEVTEGPQAGTWSIDMVDLDTAGIRWECRGRMA